MKRKLIVLLLYVLFLLGISACTSNTETVLPSIPLTNTELFPLKPTNTPEKLTSLQLYENLQLNSYENVSILDVADNKLLLNIYTDYTSDDLRFREEGYNSQTSRIITYDLDSKKTTNLLELPEVGYCTGSTFVGAARVYTYIIQKDNSQICDYKILVYQNDQTTVIESGSFLSTGYDNPWLVRLSSTEFAYSFSKFDTNTFGVNIASVSGAIKHQISLIDNGVTEHLRTTLKGDGTHFIYYAAVNGQGHIFIGNSDRIESEFVLPKTERVYDYCFLNNSIFLLWK